MTEEPVVFDCEGEQLIGVLARSHAEHSSGVLIVVGGPQYRVGSHRQFVLLARALAAAGFPSFRFDYRGMGDSSGEQRTFESVESDLCAAVAAFRAKVPEMKSLVLFGLCDAASAILMSVDRIEGVAGLILANPWVRRPESQNAVVVRHYYAERLVSRAFWTKLLSGKVSLAQSASEAARRLIDMARPSVAASGASEPRDFVARMLEGWQRFPGDRLLLLSERDLTAREFEGVYRGNPTWSRVQPRAHTTIRAIGGADHTFSDSEQRIAFERICIEFMQRVAARD